MSAWREAVEAATDAFAWVRSHRREWLVLLEIVRAEREAGERVRRGDVAKLARDRGVEATLLPRFKFDHNLWAVIARLMVIEEPANAAVLRFRRSKLDLLPLAYMWECEKAGWGW